MPRQRHKQLVGVFEPDESGIVACPLNIWVQKFGFRMIHGLYHRRGISWFNAHDKTSLHDTFRKFVRGGIPQVTNDVDSEIHKGSRFQKLLNLLSAGHGLDFTTEALICRPS